MNRFEANISTLSQHDPRLAHALRESGGGALEVTPARNGLPTARAGNRWVHSAYDPLKEAAGWAESQVRSLGSCRTLVVLGGGLLYHIDALLERMDPSIRLAVVIPELRVLHDACCARDLSHLFPRVVWAWGDLTKILHDLMALERPLRLARYEPGVRSLEAAYQDVEQALHRQMAAQTSGRLRIAVVGPIYGGSLPVARYAARAFEELGHIVRVIDHSLHATSYHSLATLREARHRMTLQSRFAEVLSQLTLARLAEDPPDLVLALAQAPLTLPVLDHLRRKQFLTAMWFVENHRHLTYWQQMAPGYDFWFVIQKDGCLDAFRHAGARQVAYLPMAADLAVHRPTSLSPKERVELGADVSFVGAGYTNRRAILPRLVCSDWTFKLWGDEWISTPVLEKVLQRNGARIDTETCVKVFNATSVNLNLHSHTGEGLDPKGDFVNPRTFELAACGAFQLVDQRSLLPELFAPEEMITFKNEDSLRNLIRSWLKDEQGRAGVAQAARRRALASHTYAHRMKDLLSQVGVSQPDRIGSILQGARRADALRTRDDVSPGLAAMLREFDGSERVDLKDVARRIRTKGPTATLSRDELLVLMLDEYRAETRDLL